MPGLSQPTLFDLFNTKIFPLSENVTNAVEELANNNSTTVRGAIYTRMEVVNFILDLVGYVSNEPIYQGCILEPSFGCGDFLFIIVDRLIKSWKHHSNLMDVNQLYDSIRAVELHKKSFNNTRHTLINQLEQYGFTESKAIDLSNHWLIQGDFLLETLDKQFDFVVGNPPYVRQELIPSSLLKEYRHRFSTMYDRADLYIPFIEKSLSLLKREGDLGFICADRWMKNRYGGPLRHLVSEEYGLKFYVDMTDTGAFHSDVSAYPAITVISKDRSSKTRILRGPKIGKQSLSSLAAELLTPNLKSGSAVREVSNVVSGNNPWILETTDQIMLMRRIESQYPLIEETGCKVGIGVATGADKAFIGNYDSLDIEEDRKLPLVKTSDIKTGRVIWQGDGVINPFDSNGKLVDLNNYPKLTNYLEKHKTVIANRHCAKKTPSNWYRTIDNIKPELTYQSKLLIPDINGRANIVFESGGFYPHHNLYYITSKVWHLRALQAVLLSSISRLFVATYSTKMRGGFLRYQAQYIRRIRLPFWKNVPEEIRRELIEAGINRNIEACNQAVFKLYRLNREEMNTIIANGE